VGRRLISPGLAGAEAALEAVAADPQAARALAQAALDAATDDETRAVALRALASAAQNLGDLDEAWRQVVLARRAARRSGVERCIVGAAGTAVTVRLLQGRRVEALRILDDAEASASAAFVPDLESQRAWVLWQVGRLLESVEVANAVLRHRPRPSAATLARVQINLGCCLADLGEHGRADVALSAAADAYRAAGSRHAALDADFDRALLAVRRGRIPEALRAFDEVLAGLRDLGAPVGHVLVAEADALLAANVTAEAFEAAVRAVAEVEAGERGLAAVAVLLHARAALAIGDLDAARGSARRAAAAWGRLANRGQVAVARHLTLSARPSGPNRRVVARLLEIGATLDAVGRRPEASAAHADALDAAAAIGDIGLAAPARASLAAARRKGPALEQAVAWYGEAVWRHAVGDRAGCQRAVCKGLARLDEHRSLLGASELQAASAAHGTRLADLGLRVALDDGRPRAVLVAAERWRAGAVRRRPERPDGLADQLAVLRRVQAETASAGEAGDDTDDLVRQQVVLEGRIRRLARHTGGSAGGPAPPDPSLVAATLGEHALVELVEHRGRLHAVTVAAGRWAGREVGTVADALEAVDHLAFALRRLGRPRDPAAAHAARQSAQQALAALDAQLLGPLAGLIDGRPLVVVPTADLHAVPWGALPSLRGVSTVVAPSSMWWSTTSVGGGRGEVLVAGPGLPGAASEVENLGRRYLKARVLTGADATASAVASAMDGAALAHVASHGRVRSDNPLFSSLTMADGPLTVYDLEQLSDAPRRVVLAACDVGVPATRPGDELLGLVASLLSLGTAGVVASTVPVPDADTTELMTSLHDHLLAGDSLAGALRHARTSVDASTPSGFVVTTAFSCFGAG
jgi:tetratricopeptide (TPR) repeat protein